MFDSLLLDWGKPRFSGGYACVKLLFLLLKEMSKAITIVSPTVN